MDEKVNPYPFIWADETRRGWLTHARIDENPVIRGHDLCFDKTCQENRLALCAELVEKNGSNNDRAMA